MQDSSVKPPQEDMARWEAEYNQLMAAGREEDYGEVMQNAWNESAVNDSGAKFDDDGLPIMDDYAFGESISGLIILGALIFLCFRERKYVHGPLCIF